MYCENDQILINNLQKIRTGAVIILACEKGFNYTKIQATIQQLPIPVVGAFFPGIIAQNELHYTGYLLIHFQEPCEVHLFDSSTDVNLTEVKVAVKSGTGFVLLDGLADGNQDFLNELYYTFSQSFNFVGSGAGSLDLKQLESTDDIVPVAPSATSIFVKVDSKLVQLHFKDILWVEALGDYVGFHVEGKRYVVKSTLAAIDKSLKFFSFIRVHRSFIVNVQHIKSLDDSSLIIQDKWIPVSRGYRPLVLEKIHLLK